MTTAGVTIRRPLWTWLCSLSSVALLLMFVALPIHIRVALGRWPHFGENYKSVLFNLHGATLFGIAMLTLFVAPLAWALLLFFRKFGFHGESILSRHWFTNSGGC